MRNVSLRGSDVRVADGERADLSSRIHIAFEQHRRDSEHIADIVETVCGVVGRQENSRIDFERQQIPDHVRILRPVQSRHQGTARIRIRRGSAIQFCGQPGNQSIASRIVRTQRALRRHHPRPKLSDNFFPDSGVAAYRGKIHLVECEPGRFGGFVVASDTVLVEDGSVIGRLGLPPRRDVGGREATNREQNVKVRAPLVKEPPLEGEVYIPNPVQGHVSSKDGVSGYLPLEAVFNVS